MRETFGGSIEIATHALQALGISAAESHEIVERFKDHDDALLFQQAPYRDDPERLLQTTRDAANQLEELLREDNPNPSAENAPDKP